MTAVMPVDRTGGMSPQQPVMEFRGVSHTYPGPPAVHALQPCDLTVGRGEYVAVVGPSGSGKSTWLNIAGLLDKPTTGTYVLDGVDTGSLPERARTALRAERLGFVFQAFHLLPYRSAVDNVALGLLYRGVPRSDRGRIASAMLDKVGLTARAAAVTSQLSGGERQRVAIARALVVRPSILLCDEPTGNLDSVTASGVLRLLDQLNDEGLSVVVVTHDRQVAGRANRTISIHDGVVQS